MAKHSNGELNDESVHLTQKALYVEPLNYPFDSSKLPTNGHEYIHLVRQEQAAIFPEETKEDFHMFMSEKLVRNSESDGKMDLKEWKNYEASLFSHLVIQLKSRKGQLMKKFPKKQFPSVQEEKDCCLVCLGSDMCSRIFGDADVENIAGNSPYLSTVLHLSQEEIFTLLGYMSEWYTVVGMNHVISRWIFALFACLRKPVSEECEAFLEKFYDGCLEKIKKCDESEKNQLHLVSAILKYHFCVKAYKIGTPLWRFQKLSY